MEVGTVTVTAEDKQQGNGHSKGWPGEVAGSRIGGSKGQGRQAGPRAQADAAT